MTQPKSSRYDRQFGDAFLDATFAARDLPVIEGLWRAWEPTLAVRLAPRIIALDEPVITDLILEEILDGSDSDPLAAALVDAMTPGTPSLTPAGVDVLIERLMDEEPLGLRYQPRRPLLQRWAVGQDGSSVDKFARSVILAEVPGVDSSVKAAAFDRARSSKKLAAAAAGDLLAQLEESPTATTWAGAFDYVTSVLVSVRPASSNVSRLVSALLRLSTQFHGTSDFGAAYSALAVEEAVPAIMEMVAGDSLNTYGGAAILRLVDQVPDGDAKRELFLIAMTDQADRYPVSDQIDKWTEADWIFRLDALLLDDDPPPNVAALMVKAPASLTPKVVALGAKYVEADEPAIRSAVVDKVRDRVAGLDGSDSDAIGAAYSWPSSAGDDDGLAFTASLLDDLNDPAGRLDAVMAGLVKKRLSPKQAAALLMDGQSAELIHRAEMTPALKRRVSPAFYDERKDEFYQVVLSNQGASFSMDLAAAIASRSPRAAFEGAVGAYDGLTESQRDELLTLLEKHATVEQEPVVARFASDSKPAARARRVRGIMLAGRLLPKGGVVPAYLADALSVSHRPIQDAVLGAVEAAQPRDLEVARRLRGIAAGDSNAAGGARQTLEGMTAAFLADLDGDIDQQRRRETLGLLGATARRASVPRLLGHVGENTPEDDPLVHRSAAEALAEAAAHEKFEPDEIDQLGRLIDEEGDLEARVALNNALARATLGEDAAINVLYDDLLGRPPKGQHSAVALFGAERDALVRALVLYHNDASQGEKGWPGVLQQLDLAAEKLTRAAYRFVGTSQAIKDQIAADPRKPDYGSILSSLQGKLAKAEAPLTIVHQLRSSHTEYSHSGQKPTQDNMTTVKDCFRRGALILVDILEQNAP